MMKPVLSQRGQVLIPVVLVMIVSLSMGVAIAYRVASTMHQAAVLTESDQAYHCAEAGIEEALGIFKTDPPPTPYSGSGDLQDASGNTVCNFSYDVSSLGGGPGALEVVLEKDEVFQVNLVGYSGSLDIRWGENTDQASLVVAVVKGSSAPYTMEKHAYNCRNHATVSGNRFTQYEATGDETYPCKMSIGPFANDASLLRIRALYNSDKGTGVQVVAYDASFPSQGYEITSTGEAGESERIVVATRSNPALPAIFDYVLFSGSDSKALEK